MWLHASVRWAKAKQSREEWWSNKPKLGFDAHLHPLPHLGTATHLLVFQEVGDVQEANVAANTCRHAFKKKKKKKKKKGNATQQPKQSWTAHKLAPKSLFVTTPCLVWRTHSTLHTPHFTLHTLNTHVMVEVAFVGAGNTTPPWATQWFVPRDGVTRMATANRASTARPADTNQALGWWRVPNTACLFASPIRSLLPLFLLFVFFVACVNGDDWCTKATTHKQQNNGLLVWSSTPQNRV